MQIGGGEEMKISVDAKILEEEIQRVFKRLPKICSDVRSLMFIIQTLCEGYKELTGKDISLDY